MHEDVWMLQLRPALGSGGASSGAATRGVSSLDLTKAVWQRIARKGIGCSDCYVCVRSLSSYSMCVTLLSL